MESMFSQVMRINLSVLENRFCLLSAGNGELVLQSSGPFQQITKSLKNERD